MITILEHMQREKRKALYKLYRQHKLVNISTINVKGTLYSVHWEKNGGDLIFRKDGDLVEYYDYEMVLDEYVNTIQLAMLTKLTYENLELSFFDENIAKDYSAVIGLITKKLFKFGKSDSEIIEELKRVSKYNYFIDITIRNIINNNLMTDFEKVEESWKIIKNRI